MLTEPLPPTLPAEPPPAPAPCVVIVTPVSAATLEPAPPPPAVLGSARPPPPPPPTAPPPPPPPLEPRFPSRIRPTRATGGAGHSRSVPATCTLAGRITALRRRRAPAGATVGRRRPGRTRPASCGRGGTGTATTAGGHNRRGRRVTTRRAHSLRLHPLRGDPARWCRHRRSPLLRIRSRHRCSEIRFRECQHRLLHPQTSSGCSRFPALRSCRSNCFLHHLRPPYLGPPRRPRRRRRPHR